MAQTRRDAARRRLRRTATLWTDTKAFDQVAASGRYFKLCAVTRELLEAIGDEAASIECAAIARRRSGSDRATRTSDAARHRLSAVTLADLHSFCLPTIATAVEPERGRATHDDLECPPHAG